MSVPKSERGMTKTEFFDKALRLHDSIIRLLLVDFGVKTRVRDLKTFSYRAKMSEKDSTTFNEICNKYEIDVEDQYPKWIIEHYRNELIKICDNLIYNITCANTIYIDVKSANAMNEFNFRRQYQWKAISNCEQMLQIFQTLMRVLPTNADRYMAYTGQITKEIDYLKSWKKSDNKILKMIQS